jgi:hypothetical protein
MSDDVKRGRPLKYGESTKTLRVPISLYEKCEKWIKRQMKVSKK